MFSEEAYEGHVRKQIVSSTILHNVGCKYCIGRELMFKELTMKLCMLLALLSGQRCQILPILQITPGTGMDLCDTKCTFTVNSQLKQSLWGTHIELYKCKNKALCVIHTLNVYLKKTKPLWGETQQPAVCYTCPECILEQNETATGGNPTAIFNAAGKRVWPQTLLCDGWSGLYSLCKHWHAGLLLWLEIVVYTSFYTMLEDGYKFLRSFWIKQHWTQALSYRGTAFR